VGRKTLTQLNSPELEIPGPRIYRNFGFSLTMKNVKIECEYAFYIFSPTMENGK